MSEVTIIGIDLAKRVFQLHGARDDGSVVFRKKLSHGQVLVFLAQQPNWGSDAEGGRTVRSHERFWFSRHDKTTRVVRVDQRL